MQSITLFPFKICTFHLTSSQINSSSSCVVHVLIFAQNKRSTIYNNNIQIKAYQKRFLLYFFVLALPFSFSYISFVSYHNCLPTCLDVNIRYYGNICPWLLIFKVVCQPWIIIFFVFFRSVSFSHISFVSYLHCSPTCLDVNTRYHRNICASLFIFKVVCQPWLIIYFFSFDQFRLRLSLFSLISIAHPIICLRLNIYFQGNICPIL